MKVLYVTMGFPPTIFTGADLLSFEVSQKLAELGVEVHILTPGPQFKNFSLRPNLFVHWCKVTKPPMSGFPLVLPLDQFSISLSMREAARRIIRDNNIEVVHSMSGDGHFIAGELPTVTYLMHPTIGDYVYSRSLIQKFYILSYGIQREKKIIRSSTLLPCVSYSSLIQFEMLYKEAIGKTSVIHAGINSLHFRPLSGHKVRRKFAVACSDTLLLHPGGGRQERKGALLLLKALYLLKDHSIKCLITGASRETGWQKRLVKAIRRYNLSNVFLTGEVSYDELPYYYAASDIVVFPTFFEGHPLPPMEALACGKPLVTTLVSDHGQIFKNYEHALLVQVGDPVGLAKSMELLISDPELRQRLAKRGREIVLREFTVNKTATKLADTYQKALRA